MVTTVETPAGRVTGVVVITDRSTTTYTYVQCAGGGCDRVEPSLDEFHGRAPMPCCGRTIDWSAAQAAEGVG